MRALLLVSIFLTIQACSTAPVVAPREYLDERTAATITMVAHPWIFNREHVSAQLDFVHLYAIDVNRMGDHRKYLAVVKYWPAPEHERYPDLLPVLVVRLQDEILELSPAEGDLKSHGVGQPLDAAAPKSAKTWLYPVDAEKLKRIASAGELSLALLANDTRADYIVWRDGRAELSEFSMIAADW